ncbi:glycoside hydrolase family 43 protein [Arthrobacter sp. CJ23]|uniref:glycoside hydrolase family 43 protein n=1 Tax=Arthrobacter sp. CJ23 TaxID=2972479 RepID=UPI00215C6A3F|nr:glycoside hydrolase family 43 protein [Arthrobacter sp. CJ23]UVJ39082.1 glycoside hydrolase family 43 protein [Arthrobacter sp. CJ23]
MIRNPILPGFHPDPSIIRAEGRYVIATSTFEWFPGVRFHVSDDLVNWHPAGYALTDPALLDLRGVPDSGGIWAPSLSHSDGRYWLVYTIVRTMAGQAKDLDNYITTAESLAGPWSDPVYVGSRGFDASLFHGPDGRRWLVGLRWDHRTGSPRFGGIQLQELDPATLERLGAPVVIHTSYSGELIEGPNLYFRDGWYNLLLAEGGTGWNHGIRLARSRDIQGPYQEDPQPVLTTRDLDPLAVARDGETGASGGLHKAGHGELVVTPDGEWYLVHLASRPLEAAEGAVCPLGRETCLQRVEWAEDGWLRLAHGGHHPALEVPAPGAVGSDGGHKPESAVRPGSSGVLAPESLGDSWMTLRGPADEAWARWVPASGTGGSDSLRLSLTGRDSLRSVFAQSLIAHRVTDTTSRLRAVVHANPAEPAHRAGVTAYYDTTGHVFWHLTADDDGRRVLAVERRDARGEIDAVLDVDPGQHGPVHLEVAFDGAAVRASASFDGETWVPLGDAIDVSPLSDDHAGLLRFTGAFVGIAATDLAEHCWTADFEKVGYGAWHAGSTTAFFTPTEQAPPIQQAPPIDPGGPMNLRAG